MDFTLQFVQGQQVEDGTINDDSTYGGSNPDRNERGNYLLLSQNDKGGARTYLSVSNTTPLSTISWTFSSARDGWHQATLLSFVLWDGATAFTADNNAVYHSSSGKFFKCIQGNTNVDPTGGSGPANWTEITDFTEIQQGYSNVEVTDYDFMVDSRIAIDLADVLYETLGETFLCKFQPEEAVNVLNLIATREGYRSKLIDEEPDQAEEIVRAMEACLD